MKSFEWICVRGEDEEEEEEEGEEEEEMYAEWEEILTNHSKDKEKSILSDALVDQLAQKYGPFTHTPAL